jgi:hypothetical protein
MKAESSGTARSLDASRTANRRSDLLFVTVFAEKQLVLWYSVFVMVFNA